MSVPVPRFVAKLLPEHFVTNELSLLVFGPGHGEAMVVILPDGSLGVIDGCREPPGDPVDAFVSSWLNEDSARRISFVGLTHPHEDHYRGLGRLIDNYDRRIDALWRTQLTGGRWGQSYVQYAEFCEQNDDSVPIADELAGLTRVIGAFERRRDRLDVLCQDKTMLSRSVCDHDLSVLCLAPSANDVDRAQSDLLEVIRSESRVGHDPNLTSSALLVKWGGAQLLLGGDLVCACRGFEGWASAQRSVRGTTQIVKASHHASSQALHWDLLERVASTLTIVTPFKHAVSSYPPQPEGIQGLLGRRQAVAITSIPEWAASCGVKGTRPIDPPPPRAQRRRERNPALAIAPVSPVETNNAVGVSLTADGTITRLVLAGNARLYSAG
mgnify:CR=1 FL=1